MEAPTRLKLKRRYGETLILTGPDGRDIVITFLGAHGCQVTVEAFPDIRILRGELQEKPEAA